jgi:PAS domain S-box-containing protein
MQDRSAMTPAEQHWYDLAFASLPEPTLLFDERGRLVHANAAARSLLGERVAQAVEHGLPVTRALPWLSEPVVRVLSGAYEVGVEAEVPSQDGPRRVVARLRRVGDGAGEVRGVVAAMADVTERRALEAEARSAERLEALGSLAAGLAHEVNSPLAAVVAGLSFLEEEHARLARTVEADLGEASSALSDAREAATRVGKIIEDLRAFAHSVQAARRRSALGVHAG